LMETIIPAVKMLMLCLHLDL